MITTAQTPENLDVASFRGRLQAIYAGADAEVAAAGPTCALSGRCCRFHEADHTLFLTAPEAALLLADAPPPCRPLDDGATCPWQDGRGHCTARAARPLGCRVYYCDPAYAPQAPEVTERALARLRAMADELGLPWGYAPLHHHLRRAAEAGRFPAPTAEPGETPPDPLSTPHGPP